MRCPNCNEEIEDGFLYCKKCGTEIRIVPDYNPIVEDALSGTLKDIFDEDRTKEPGKQKKLRREPIGSRPHYSISSYSASYISCL